MRHCTWRTSQPGWPNEGLQQAGSRPGPGGQAGHPQDGFHHSLWTVGVPEDALWAQECWPVIQRSMDEVLDYIFVYLDDILVAIDTMEEHKVHLEEVFRCLQ